MISPAPPPPLSPTPALPADDRRLRQAANALEATFLAEMPKAAGHGTPSAEFGGGAGEQQFASFLTRAHAEALVEAGGIGLAERLFEALKARADGAV